MSYGFREIWKEKFYSNNQDWKVCGSPVGRQGRRNGLQELQHEILPPKGRLRKMLLKEYGLVRDAQERQT